MGQEELMKRHIIIDGSNVAMDYGRHKHYNCKGIKLCLKYFKDRGHSEMIALVPRWRLEVPPKQQRKIKGKDKPIRNQKVLKTLYEEGLLTDTPTKCYDDKTILELARKTDDAVSNDKYRDLYIKDDKWHNIIKNRLIKFTFSKDIFLPMRDPYGRSEPFLNQILFVPNPERTPMEHEQN